MNEQHFANIYDELMQDVPYEKWVSYTKKYIQTGSKVLDVACGTGTFAMALQRNGYNVQGTDISQDMLTIAENKMRKENITFPLFKQDMRQLSGFSSLDGVTLFCDGLNYLLQEGDVQETFQRIGRILRPGGVFLFDVHSIYKIKTIFNDHLFGENNEDISYLWFCTPGEYSNSVEHCLTFFVKTEDQTYERMDEEHEQRTFSPHQYCSWLKEAGFSDIEVTSDFGRTSISETDERIFLKAIKK
ncbi:class I SAM-dependent methyltransferase [Evansella sp. AB-P1]|uniref:class I SAM-dependent DNA methyltransferase n=1 Tax=Evansella sp. AB-P1 TaxID=3037653 RepID=UPI00241C890C|nr:class I SAM-dependent methyltransferase [Evansella sp. AB-P1]MDG5786517.1 class I SAM-dependent methyltransferase [Evansella sp. AB-P1]